jgi:hypothetical protein
LLELGISSHQVRYRARIGRLRPLYPGVFVAGDAPLTQRGRWMAAVLASGKGAVLSHRSAAALWGFGDQGESRLDVTVPHTTSDGRRTKRRAITVHRTRWLPDDHVCRRYGIPVTTPARTLLDLAATVSPTRLRRAFESADRLELLRPAALAAICERARGRKGTGHLRSLLADHRELPWTRSELEGRFLRLCDRAGIPRPAVNVEVEGFEVDFFWPEARLVVELDGYSFHRGRAAFERDRRRDAVLQMAGCRVLRVTDRRMTADPGSVVAEVRGLLRARPL